MYKNTQICPDTLHHREFVWTFCLIIIKMSLEKTGIVLKNLDLFFINRSKNMLICSSIGYKKDLFLFVFMYFFASTIAFSSLLAPLASTPLKQLSFEVDTVMFWCLYRYLSCVFKSRGHTLWNPRWSSMLESSASHGCLKLQHVCFILGHMFGSVDRTENVTPDWVAFWSCVCHKCLSSFTEN